MVAAFIVAEPSYQGNYIITEFLAAFTYPMTGMAAPVIRTVFLPYGERWVSILMVRVRAAAV